MNPDSQIRMTNDEIRRNAKIRMTNPAIANQRVLRNLGFGFLLSAVIRHSRVSDKFPSWEGLGVGSCSQCMRKNENSLAMSVPSFTQASLLTRRQFLQSSGLAVVAGTLAAPKAVAQSTVSPRVTKLV